MRSEIYLDEHSSLVLPRVHIGHDSLDSLIESAWRGQYASTEDMLECTECLDTVQDSRGRVEPVTSKAELIARITQWRKDPEEQHGNLSIKILEVNGLDRLTFFIRLCPLFFANSTSATNSSRALWVECG